MYEDRKYNVFGIICLLLCVSVSAYVCDETKEGCGVFSYDCHFIPLKQQLSLYLELGWLPAGPDNPPVVATSLMLFITLVLGSKLRSSHYTCTAPVWSF